MRTFGGEEDIIQRKALALAVGLAWVLPARIAAQSDEPDILPSGIEIYGSANVTSERLFVSGRRSYWDIVDNVSRLGFRGRSELGTDLNAIFQIESRIRINTGTTFLASRASYVGLQGRFGIARIGRTAGPVYRATYEFISLHNNNAGSSADAFIAGTIRGHQLVMNNTVWYTSPQLGPVTMNVAYSLLGEAPVAGMSQPRHLGLVVAYDQGALHLAVSRADTANTDDRGGLTASKDVATTIGGLYDMKAVVVGALFERATSRLPGDQATRNYVRVSAMVPVQPHEFHVNAGRVNHRLDAKLSDDGAVQWTLGYNYNLSGATKLYTFYTVVDNRNNGNYGFITNERGVDNKSLAVGMRQRF